MSLVFLDRAKETTATTGTGTITLAGAVSGFQSFAGVGNGNTTYYTLVSGNDWEVGIGTYTTSGTTLSRDTVLSSSNSGSKITLAGVSTAYICYPSGKAVSVDSTNRISAYAGMYFTTEYDNGNSGTSKTVDWTNGNCQKLTLTGNCVITFTGAGVGNYRLRLIQDGVGGRTITLTGYYTSGGVAPVLTTTIGATDILGVYFDGTKYYCGIAIYNPTIN